MSLGARQIGLTLEVGTMNPNTQQAIFCIGTITRRASVLWCPENGQIAVQISDTPVGTSHGWRDAIRRATQVAATEATTCLQGESGTGKEVIARFIHLRSPRSRGPFIAINWAALPEQILESELFEFERGAFTGALQSKPGQIELAASGVLFLDEVTEMTPACARETSR